MNADVAIPAHEHLGALEEAGLITITPRGRGHAYSLTAARMQSLLSSWAARFDP